MPPRKLRSSLGAHDKDISANDPAHCHRSKSLDNKYLLGDEIGKGAYGRVYKALDLVNADFVAIKQVSLENIPQEYLSVIMNLYHNNIVKYLGSLKMKAHLHILLECMLSFVKLALRRYVENGSLASPINLDPSRSQWWHYTLLKFWKAWSICMSKVLFIVILKVQIF